jgi:pimeloyl-ACP methyl ester carboxylesterase
LEVLAGERDRAGKPPHQIVERLPTLAVPTLILHGAEDEYAPLSWARSAHTLIKGSELQTSRSADSV